jgi:hypothetical protein
MLTTIIIVSIKDGIEMRMKWPYNKKFAFTIVDDTDNGTVGNTKPVYDFLYSKGILTTKTVWIYPSRDNFSGGYLLDDDYLDFITDLKNKGFEIGLHNVGSGKFSREEIIEGINLFYEKLGFYPKLQINHASNPDNIYWGAERYQSLLRNLFKVLYGNKRKYYGSDIESSYFWGDICKEKIKYIRNHTFNDINTLKIDPLMPYIDKSKQKYSNYWFSSSDGHTVEEFNFLLKKENIDKLETEGGACIVYTHFASNFVDDAGRLNKEFVKNMEYLSTKDGWFVPASIMLDYLASQKNEVYASKIYLTKLDFKWVFDRVIKKLKFNR